ncbi:EAL and HDOD domain-containing protein [Vogesella facilis]|uniref:EAL and HDOD domain-containing protein n=1 Tax=Vogesella facilis TaxID=1655232 RepID=A0ABV7R9V8_9NEIS
MLKSLFGGLGKGSKDEPAANEPGAVPAAATPDPAAQAAPALPPTFGFVMHQAVHDSQQRVVAYEFMVRDALRRKESSASQWVQFDHLMISTLINMDVFRLLAFRRALVHISTTSLSDPALEGFPADRVFFVLNPPSDEPVTAAIIAEIDRHKAQGRRFALEPALFGHHVASELLQDELLSRMDILVLDFAAAVDDVLAPFLDQLPGKYPAARWYARNIGSAEEFDVCLKTPGAAKRFALYQGSFLTNFHPLPAAQVDASQMRIMEIMRLLRAGAESKELDAQFKLDSLLLFKLLRFINSPMNGLSRKVMTIEESLMLIGRDSLFKWLTLLLFTTRKDDGRSVALLERSLFRAHFMQKLGEMGGNHKLECEHLFLTGMFSLLDALMQVKLADALEPLELPPTVADALLNQRGLFAPYLALAMAAEQDNIERVTTLARMLKLEPAVVNRSHLDAMVWAQEMLTPASE